jgi:hypothetical protein
MDQGYWISNSQRRLEDALALFRHRSRQTQEDFSEIHYHWPDRRGHSYQLANLEPQIVTMQSGENLLSDQTESTRLAQEAVAASGDRVANSRAAKQDCDIDTEQSVRLTQSSNDLSGRSTVAAGDVVSETARILAIVQGLLK